MSPHLLFCHLSTFSLGNLKSAGLANAHVNSQKLLRNPFGYYGSASVPKWPQKQSQSISFQKVSCGSMPADPPSPACLCMHLFTSDTHVTPLLKSLATGLKNSQYRRRTDNYHPVLDDSSHALLDDINWIIMNRTVPDKRPWTLAWDNTVHNDLSVSVLTSSEPMVLAHYSVGHSDSKLDTALLVEE